MLLTETEDHVDCCHANRALLRTDRVLERSFLFTPSHSPLETWGEIRLDWTRSGTSSDGKYSTGAIDLHQSKH